MIISFRRKIMKKKTRKNIAGLVGLVAVLAIGVFLGGQYMKKNDSNGVVLAEAKYPKQSDSVTKPVKSYIDFVTKYNEAVLTGKKENALYSPMNVYLALSMLAESASEQSQAELLELLAAESIDEVRDNAKQLWQSNYQDGEEVVSILANSIWMQEGLPYKEETIDILKNDYYASSFMGQLGDEKTTQHLRDWLNKNTKDLLKDNVNNFNLEDDTLVALFSSIYYSSSWMEGFAKELNERHEFYAPDGVLDVEYMRDFSTDKITLGQDFKAYSRELKKGHKMTFVLPDKEKSVDELLVSDDFNRLLSNQELDQKSYRIDLSIPKFDISNELSLKESLEKLNIQKIFDPIQARLAGLFDLDNLNENAYVSKISHVARNKINEDGFEGAGYTSIGITATSMPEEEYELLDFKLDRPFIYFVTNELNEVLFVGVVNNPNQE